MTSGLPPGEASLEVAREKGSQMSDMVQTTARTARGTQPTSARLAVTAGIAAAVAGAALAAYAVYGDPRAQASEKGGVPFMVAAAVLVAGVVFGLLVPRALRAMRDGSTSAPRWGLALSIFALVTTPVLGWSGVPLVIGASGLVLGTDGRRQARSQGTGTGRCTAAIVLGVIAILGGVAMAVLGNLGQHH